MSKFIAYIVGQPVAQGYKIHEFHWNQDQGVYVYQSRTFDEKEIEAATREAQSRYGNQYRIYVRCVEPSALPVDLNKVEDLDSPISTITDREITLDEALEVVSRLNPNLLRRRHAEKAG
jgi:hypothetical protein